MRFAVVALALWLTGCSEQWEGFVHPDKGNLQRSQAVGVYPSLEECRLAARRALADPFNARGDYECGLNCDDGPSMAASSSAEVNPAVFVSRPDPLLAQGEGGALPRGRARVGAESGARVNERRPSWRITCSAVGSIFRTAKGLGSPSRRPFPCSVLLRA